MLGSKFGLVAQRFPQHKIVWVRLRFNKSNLN